MANTIHLGSLEGIELILRQDEKKNDTGLIWGLGQLYADGFPLLSGEQERVEWTWVDLLEWLGTNWAYILCEQNLPFRSPSTSLLTLMRDLEKRWENMPEARVEEEEEEAYRFFNRHDLANAFKGLFFPSVFIMRQGGLVEIISAEANKTIRLPLNRLVLDLEQIGNQLAKFAASACNGRGPFAANQWLARSRQLELKATPLLTGLSASELSLINANNDPNFWEQDQTNPFNDNELMAAARMTSGMLLPEEKVYIIEKIRAVPKVSTAVLDALAQDFAKNFVEIGKPHDQGYWAAIWLRRKLGLQTADKAQPMDCLRSWGVQVHSIMLPDSKLAALACWGDHHGPAILINKANDNTAAHIHGENTTLAHEICHLLIDRTGGLPVAEVLNGNTPERLEKRARAFAAEFLLPRDCAIAQIKKADNLNAAVTEISEIYEVSEELICWQIINSDFFASLTEKEQDWLRSQVG